MFPMSLPESKTAASSPAVQMEAQQTGAEATSDGAKRKAPPLPARSHKKKAIRYRTPEQMYGRPVSHHVVRGVCAGCLGQKNEELKDDPIVLCDGQDCGREYHLQCCLPPLTQEEIPEGSYLCIDCDPDGASSRLQRYFDRTWESRSKFKTSRDFAASLFENEGRVPVSEFPRITELHRDAISSVRTFQGASSPDIGPDFLVGKPLRLYCPDDNNYHNGRILDWRRATHLRPISATAPSHAKDFQYGNISEIACCEFLVAFPAGMDFRKRTIHQWMILEEHSLAVGTSLIWALHTRNKEWTPALTWLRTSLELMPILERLSEDEGQVIYDMSNLGQTKRWALTQPFGRENHLLLILREEAVDLFSPSFAARFSKRIDTADGPRLDLPAMLAFTEAQEQRRIRQWSRLSLQNARHERALTIADVDTLPPLEVSTNKNDGAVEISPRPCPLIRTGLDRMWIANQLRRSQGFDQTKDAVAGITVHGVRSRASAIKQLQEQAKGATTMAALADANKAQKK